MEKQNKPISEMSKAEIKAYLENQEKAEKAEKQKAKKQFIEDKDNFLQHTASKFQQIQAEMRQLKDYTISKANELYERMYKMEGKEAREVQSFTMKDENDTMKVTVDRQSILEFDENAVVHINTIKDMFKAKFEGRNKGMYGYINDILIKNSKGDYDPRLITKVKTRAVKLGHTEILKEVEKLEQCRRVSGTALYCRCYIRDKNKKWQDVSLQFSSL
ncbi:hypothetical protein GGR32_000164 [Mesonia hippocampi]|uniref:DUF3164 family protein n=1 Tax=Mesonia hippocampi TaxID=1628250 RepID=A0A840EFB4_9FLAO|nr:DUF3164 family protein [Mesonia hippocampi]MBB4117892.1 hypothetical protein [Mesonia hippocampi]